MTNTFSFDYEKADMIISEKLSVYLYGMGVHLRNTFDKLKELEIPILGIVDKNEEFWGHDWEGITIYPPQKLEDKNTPIIICTRGSFDEIYYELNSRDFSCILPFYFYQDKRQQMSQNYQSLSDRENAIRMKLKSLEEKDAVILNSIDFIVTERCSLRCRDCSNLMQYYNNPVDEDIHLQFDALSSIMDAVDYVYGIRILGGEPFMNTNVHRYIEYALSFDNAAMVTIYTNGTIIPQNENLSCLVNPRVFVRISDYGITSKNLGKLQNLFEENNIHYETMECRRWKKCDEIKPRERTESELRKVFDLCCVKKLFTLKNGVLYGCPFAANAAALKATRRNVDDEICTNTPRNELRKLLRRLQNAKWYDACKYCGGRPLNVTDIPAAIQADAPLPYTRYEDL